jgi:hypothetical protein
MAETPFSVGSGKPLISRVPKGGGSALRPRPVPGAKAPELSAFPGTPQGREGLDLPVEAPAGAALAAQRPGTSDLWARLAAASKRTQNLAERVRRVKVFNRFDGSVKDL